MARRRLTFIFFGLTVVMRRCHCLGLRCVAADDHVGVAAGVVGAAVLGRKLGTATAVGKAFGGPVSAMALTFAASSASLLPSHAALIPTMRDAAVKFATPLLLLDADLEEIFKTSGPHLAVFCAAAVGTLLSGLLAWRLAGRWLTSALGARDASAAAAALLAKNIGGGVNFVAVALATGLSPRAQATALAVDNVMALVYFPAINAFAGQVYNSTKTTTDSGVAHSSVPSTIGAAELLHAALAALLILSVAQRLAPTATLPAATLISVIAATVSPRKLRRAVAPAATVMADALLYVFFAAAGCAGGSIAACAQAAGPPLFAFLIVLYAGHLLFLTGIAAPLFFSRIKSNRRPMLAISSNACIGGPATAAAMCTAKGWSAAVPAAVCVGTFGNRVKSETEIIIGLVTVDTVKG